MLTNTHTLTHVDTRTHTHTHTHTHTLMNEDTGKGSVWGRMMLNIR